MRARHNSHSTQLYSINLNMKKAVQGCMSASKYVCLSQLFLTIIKQDHIHACRPQKFNQLTVKTKPDGIWKQHGEKSKTVKEEIFWIKDDILQPIWMVVWRHHTSAEGPGPVMATSQNQFKFQHLCQCNFFSASFLALTTLETPCSSVFPFYQQLCNLSHH